MYTKLHKGSTIVLAVCDEDLIGKKFEEGKLFLEVNEAFYKGEKKTKEEVLELLNEIKNVNLVGEESVSVGIEAGIISKDHVLNMGGVPHAQFFVL